MLGGKNIGPLGPFKEKGAPEVGGLNRCDGCKGNCGNLIGDIPGPNLKRSMNSAEDISSFILSSSSCLSFDKFSGSSWNEPSSLLWLLLIFCLWSSIWSCSSMLLLCLLFKGVPNDDLGDNDSILDRGIGCCGKRTSIGGG